MTDANRRAISKANAKEVQETAQAGRRFSEAANGAEEPAQAKSGGPEATPAKPQTGASRGEDSRYAERAATERKPSQSSRGTPEVFNNRRKPSGDSPKAAGRNQERAQARSRNRRAPAEGIENRRKPEGDPEANAED